ncbi:MAG: hypothetical protein KatS3mg080_1043 [Anoxybacillus sp.]|nr:MAG: hypothetical protein KatS3mg080_1043 [Anoxybacillus sp.]
MLSDDQKHPSLFGEEEEDEGMKLRAMLTIILASTLTTVWMQSQQDDRRMNRLA